MTSRALLATLAILTLSACAAPAAPAPTPPPQTAQAAPAPSAPEAPPSARVLAVEPGRESIPDVRAKIVFTNPTRRACRFTGYKLVWAGASKAIKLDGLTVPPGETRERWLKMHAGDGDLQKLLPGTATVEIEVDCAAP